MAVKKLKLPDNSSQDIHDARITGVDSTPTASSTNVVTSGGVATALAGVSPKIYVGTCTTSASTAAKVATVETFPLDANDAPLVGTTIAVKFSSTNSANNPTLAVNGTAAASIYYNDSVLTTANVSFAGYASRHTLFVWNGTYWVWLSHGVDNNTNAYTLRTNSTTKNMANKLYNYRFLFTSADGTKWVAANSTNSSGTDTVKTVTTEKIDPFGAIVAYSSTTTVSAGSAPSTLVLYEQGALNIGYSFNTTGSAPSLTNKLPVYIKAAPQTDGSVIIDATTPYVQTLPSTEDSKVYIYLGLCFDSKSVELVPYHPVYYYKDGQIRLWTNAVSGGYAGTLDTTATTAQSTSASESLSGSVTLHKIAKTGTYSDLIGTPTIPDTTTVAGWGYAKYYLCQDETAYNNIQSKDSGTLYLIPES